MSRKLVAVLTTVAILFGSLGVGKVSVTAAALEFDIQNGVLVKYNGSGGTVTIPSGVTRIGDSAFANSSVTSVDVPYGVTDIGNRAFANCYYDLTSVNLPSSLLTIGDGAFRSCRGLSYISLPYGLQRIGTEAFYDSGLTSVSIPSSVTSLGTGVFLACYSLQSAALSSGLSEIPRNTFSSCWKLTEISIPSNVSSIGDTAFSNCDILRSVSIPSSVTQFGASIFSGSPSVTVYGSAGSQAERYCSNNSIPFSSGTPGQPADVKVSGVSLSNTTLTLSVGEAFALTAYVSPTNASNKAVTWTDSGNGVLGVDMNGKVSAWREGTAVVSVITRDGGYSASCSVTVKAQTVPVTSVTLDKTSINLNVNETAMLAATVFPSNATNKTLYFTTSNSSIATISSNGIVTGKSAGNATITVRTADGDYSASCSVKVAVADTKIIVTAVSDKYTGTIADKFNITATTNIDASRVTIQFDGNSSVYQMLGSSKSWSWLADLNAGNPRVITITAYDSKGNTAQTTLRITVTDNTQKIAVVATSDKYIGTTEDKFNITATTNVDASRVTIQFDGSSNIYQMTGSGKTWSWLADLNAGNPRILTITAYDSKNNFAQTTLDIIVTDAQKIAVTATSDKYSGTTADKFSIAATTNIDASKVTIQFDGSGTVYQMSGGGKSWTWLADLSAGNPRILTITAYDAKGNTAQTTLKITVTESQKIAVTATSDKYSGTTDDKFNITATTNIAASKVTIQFDGNSGVYQMNGSGLKWTWVADLNAGNRVLTITAYDAKSNTATTKLNIEVKAVVTKPTLGNFSVDDIKQTSARLSYNFSGQNITEYGYILGATSNPTAKNKLGGNVSGNITDAYYFSGLTAGTTYYYKIYAKNSAGETASAVKSFTTSPATPNIAIESAVSDKYEGHTDEKFNITVRTNIAAQTVRIAYDGTTRTTDMNHSADRRTWTFPASMYPGNPRVLTITAYDNSGKASGAVVIRIKVNGNNTDTTFAPIWPAPGNYQISTLTKYDSPVTLNGKSTYKHGTWNGRNKLSAIDITGYSGDKIVAVESGTVLASGYSTSGFGYYVRIQHYDAQKTESLYAHLKEASPLVAGAKVNKGDTVGKMGNTGGNYGVHLHFELFNKNPWKDYYNNPNYVNYVPNLTYTMGAKKWGQPDPNTFD